MNLVNRKIVLVCLALCLWAGALSAQNLKSILSDVAITVVGDKVTTTESIVWTWNCNGPECRFESDNLLAEAGGTVVSSKVEDKLSSVYSKLGLEGYTLTFDGEGNYTLTTRKGKSVNGTYTFDAECKSVALKSRLGLTCTVQVAVPGSTMSLLFNAAKLMSALQPLSGLTSQVNATASTLSSLASSYDGMLLGFELSKQ